MNTSSRLVASLALAALCAAAHSQTAPMAPASQPAAIAVTPETARAANDKAVQRPEVATVVRTGPTAADKAREAKSDVQTTAANASASDGTTMTANNTTGNANRAPRVDRH